jgi:hypothetical protein
MRPAAFHGRARGENACMDPTRLSGVAVAFLAVALFLGAVVGGAALRAAVG